MSVTSKVEQAEALKAEGNALFRAGDCAGAVAKYAFAYMYVKGLGESAGGLTGMGSQEDQLSAEERARVDAASTSIQLNQAACYLKLGRHDKALKTCTNVLGVDADNVKALLRRGQAYLALGDLERARADLKAALAFKPGDSAIRASLKELAALERKQNEKQRAAFGGMFDSK